MMNVRRWRNLSEKDPSIKRRLDLNDRAGIRLNKNFNSIAVEAGGYENLIFGEKDARSYIEKVRRLQLGEGDGEAICNYFREKQERNGNFFHAIDLDDDSRLRNVFWADARSRTAYECFGDYESAIKNKAEKEAELDYKSFRCVHDCEIREFQAELKELMHCETSLLSSKGSAYSYQVNEYGVEDIAASPMRNVKLHYVHCEI
ncbi:Protein FAR-RED IMPAIRED RESPONSE 1 [Ananas comosus]|uniref:Protein FAR-RED IMPAIRED RESPONSE 1 n=1 Tax=Ananas comosus TaxID=4615 RepID=A0A199UW94_ANACO|nr:Protein FAR-RED IMPAIRED RESPONSE 1 [Ananas comosus]